MKDTQPHIAWQLDDKSASLTIMYGGRVLIHWDLSKWAAVTPGRLAVRRVIAWDFVKTSHDRHHPMTSWDETLENQQTVIRLSDRLSRHHITLTFTALGSWHIAIRIKTSHPDQFIRMVWLTEENDSWQGFGEHTHSIRPPARFDSWVEEGPVGWGFLSRIFKHTPWFPFPKGPYASYASLPLWLSSAGYSAWFTSFERIRWNLQQTMRSATVWGADTTLHVIAGHTPKQVLSRQFLVLGTPSPPGPWVLAPWNDSIQGQQSALTLARFLREHRIPSGTLWIEDWMGSHQDDRRFWMRPLTHQVDTDLYPDLPDLSQTLHAQGFRLLGYFCPEITEGTDLYHQALRDDILVKDRVGNPAVIKILGINHGQLDLTHPSAFTWIHDHLLYPALQLGFDGWMADFGEYLPLTAKLSDGTSGTVSHNRYPLLWQAIHRQFWRQYRPDDEYVFFVRSGWIGTHRLAPVVWGGDSDTDFEEGDGLPTVIPEALSAQVAGFFYWATDIGGYMTFGLTRPSTKSLFIRWVQAASLLPVMRTHHGTAAPRNWRLDRDSETLEIYSRYARLHTALYPYFHHLCTLAEQMGWPLIRPLYLEFPEDKTSWRLDQEFMVGDGLVVAPVLTSSSSSHPIYLPSGKWRSWWTNKVYEGPQWISENVPLDQLPVFIRDPFFVPLLEGVPATGTDAGISQMEGVVDSLSPITTGPGVGLNRALDYLALYLCVSNTAYQKLFRLPDGGYLRLEFQPLPQIFSKPLRLPSPVFSDHFPQFASFGTTVLLKPGESHEIRINHGIVTLSASEDSRKRQYILRWW